MAQLQSTSYSNFLKLLRSELWHTPLELTLSHSEFLSVYELASKQAVLGMVANSLIRNNVSLDREDVMKVLAVQGRIIASNKAVNSELLLLCKLFVDNGIESIVVKGQTIGRYYPNPLVRTPGDIDFYCNETNLPKVISAMANTWGIRTEGKPSEQHYELVHNSIILELHHCLMKFASNKSQKIWDEIFRSSSPTIVEVDGCLVPTLEPTLNVLYTFLHLYHHLVELGVGLRQFSDVAVLLKTHYNLIDKKKFFAWLDALDFRKAFDVVQLILVNILGMDEKYALSPLSYDKDSLKAMNQFMDVVWFGGNFGFHGHNRRFKFKIQYFSITTYRKLKLYYRFYRFSPREIKASVFSSIPHKILKAIKGDLKGI